MPISNLNLPQAGAVDFSGGNIDYYTINDPVYYEVDNRPLTNMAYRDFITGAKVDEIIDAMGITQSYWPHPQDTPDNTLHMYAGRHINFAGTGLVIKSSDFSSGTFATVTAGKTRYDLVTINDAGTVEITQGSEVTSPGDPVADSPAIPATKLAIAIIRVNEDTTVVIDTADITDCREFLNKGGATGTYISQDEMDIYRPHTQTSPNTTVRVEAGQHIKSDGSGAIIVGSAANSGSFAVVTVAGKARYDLLNIDDSGVLQILQGSEVTAPGTPLTDAPTFPTDALPIAIVKVDEDATVVVNDTDITDVRPFLNLGGGAGAGAGATQLYEKQVAATTGQTVFTLVLGTYVIGSDTLQVFRNGKKLVKLDEYTETANNIVTLVNGATEDDVFEFIVPAAGAGEGECYKRDDFVAGVAQTNFTTSQTAAPSQANTMVLSGGDLMVHGDDYTFSGDDVVFGIARSEGEKVAVIKVTCGGDECCGGILNYEIQTATAAQTVFDLGFTYTLGSNRLFVLVEGVKQILGDDYNETDDDTITFLVGVTVGKKVEFVYYGQAGCNDVRCPAPTLIDRIVIATQGQTEINLTGTYQVGTHTLRVYRNGIHSFSGVHYTEVNSGRIDWLTPLNVDEEIVLLQYGEVGDRVVTQSQDFASDSGGGQTEYNLNFSYLVGTGDLLVFSGGVYMEPDEDYIETDPTTITFLVGRSPSERVVVKRIGADTAAAVKLWEKHIATQDQTLFNLEGTYVVGSKALEVFYQGQLLTPGDQYNETNENTVTLTFNANADTTLIFKVPGGDVISCRDSGLLSRELQVATSGQTVFNLGFNYTVGSYGLFVFVEGAEQIVDVDYTETGQGQVTFTSGVTLNDKVEFKNLTKVTGPHDGVLNQKLFDANAGQLAVGQTAIALPFRYLTNSHMLKVVRNGFVLAESIDYTETDAQTITLTTAIASATEWVEVYAIAQAKAGSRAHTLAFHDDGAAMMAAGQTYKDLEIEATSVTQVVIRSGTKVLADNWETYINFAADVTVDITTSGDLGLDQGTEAADTWYYIHAIKNTVTGAVSGLLSINKENPLLPTGYDVHRCIGAVRNDGSSNFRTFLQINERVHYAQGVKIANDVLMPVAGITFDASSTLPLGISKELFTYLRIRVVIVQTATVNIGRGPSGWAELGVSTSASDVATTYEQVDGTIRTSDSGVIAAGTNGVNNWCTVLISARGFILDI